MPKIVDLIPTAEGQKNGAKAFSTPEVNAREVLANSTWYRRKPAQASDMAAKLAPDLEMMTDFDLKVLLLKAGGKPEGIATREDLVQAVKATIEAAFSVETAESKANEQATLDEEIDRLRKELESLHVTVDMRWGVDRLRQEIAKARMPKAPKS